MKETQSRFASALLPRFSPQQPGPPPAAADVATTLSRAILLSHDNFYRNWVSPHNLGFSDTTGTHTRTKLALSVWQLCHRFSLRQQEEDRDASFKVHFINMKGKHTEQTANMLLHYIICCVLAESYSRSWDKKHKAGCSGALQAF